MARDNADRSAHDPSQIAARGFGTGFRGYDQDEVRDFLARVAAAMADVLDQQVALNVRLREAEERAARPPQLDEDQLTAALGAETASVLHAAHQAAADIRAKATDNVARLVREADENRQQSEQESRERRDEADAYAGRTRADSEAEAARRLAEADTAAAATRAEAEADAGRVRAEADAHATRIRAEADAVLAVRSAEANEEAGRIRAAADEVLAQAGRDAEGVVEAAREQGRDLVVEAEQVRERVLKDLGRRRRLARQQLQQLRAARERLLEAYDVVRRTVDDATGELLVALPEARAAAEEIGRAATEEHEDSVADLEAELGLTHHAGASPEAEAEPVAEPAVVPEPAPEAVAVEPPPAVSPRSPEQSPPVVAAAPEPAAEPAVVALEPPPAVSPRSPEQPPVVAAAPEPAAEPEAVALEPPPTVPARSPEPAVSEPAPDRQPETGPGPVDTARHPASEDDPHASEVDSLFARLRAGEPPADEDADGEDALVSLLEQRDGATEELEARLARRLKRVLADEQSTVLDTVRRAKALPPFASVLPGSDEHGSPYAEAAVDDLVAAAVAGATFAGTSDAPAPRVDDLALALADEVTGLLRSRLQRSFDDVDGDDRAPPVTPAAVLRRRRRRRGGADRSAPGLLPGGQDPARRRCGTPLRAGRVLSRPVRGPPLRHPSPVGGRQRRAAVPGCRGQRPRRRGRQGRAVPHRAHVAAGAPRVPLPGGSGSSVGSAPCGPQLRCLAGHGEPGPLRAGDGWRWWSASWWPSS